MTPEDRIKAVADFGFTQRQARFLVLVMRHAGVCVPRHALALCDGFVTDPRPDVGDKARKPN